MPPHLEPSNDDNDGGTGIETNQVSIEDDSSTIHPIDVMMDDLSSIVSTTNNSLSGAVAGPILNNSGNDNSGNCSGSNSVAGARRPGRSPKSFSADSAAPSPSVFVGNPIMNNITDSSSSSIHNRSNINNKVKSNNMSNSDLSSRSPRGDGSISSGVYVAGVGSSSAAASVPAASVPAASAVSSSSSPIVYQTPKTTMRVRITNELSQRSKDVIVDTSSTTSLFEAVYDHPGVKEAHVRKWPPTVAQKVKRQEAEIKCAVWDKDVGQPSRVLTIDELKQTTARQLYEFLEIGNNHNVISGNSDNGGSCSDSSGIVDSFSDPDGDVQQPRPQYNQAPELVYLVLQCVEATSKSQTENHAQDNNVDNHHPNRDSTDNHCQTTMVTTTTTMATPRLNPLMPIKTGTIATVATAEATSTPLRCPFSGVEFSPDMMEKFKEHIRTSQPPDDDNDEQMSSSSCSSSSFETDYKSAGTHSRTVQPYFSDASLDIYCLVEEEQEQEEGLAEDYPEQQRYQQHDQSHHHQQQQQQQQQDLLQRQEPHQQQHTTAQVDQQLQQSIASSSIVSTSARQVTEDTVVSGESSFAHDPISLHGNPQKQCLRIRLSNRSSDRFKDLVVDISDKINLRDAVYDHPGVKEAHVRKWGPQIVQDVKNGLAEIQIVVWDDDAARPWRTFCVEELSTTSTRDLYETVSESCDLVKLFLECVKVKRGPNTSNPNSSPANILPSPPTMIEGTSNTKTRPLEYGKPQARTSTNVKEHSPIITASVSSMRLGKGAHQSSVPTIKALEHSGSVDRALTHHGNGSGTKLSKRGSRLNHMAFPGAASLGESSSGSFSTMSNSEGASRHRIIDNGFAAYQRNRSMSMSRINMPMPATMPTSSDDGSLHERRHGRRTKMDLDALLMQSNMRSKQAREHEKPSFESAVAASTKNINASWNQSVYAPQPIAQPSTELQVENDELSSKIERFLQKSKSTISMGSITDTTESRKEPSSEQQGIKEFQQLYNAKKSVSLQSSDSSTQPRLRSSLNDSFPTIVQTPSEKENPFLRRVSSLTLQGGRPVVSTSSTRGAPNASFSTIPIPPSSTFDVSSSRVVTSHDGNNLSGRSSLATVPKVSDRIGRFLRFSQSSEERTTIVSASSDHNKGLQASASSLSHKTGSTPSLNPVKENHRYSSPVMHRNSSSEHLRMPIAEDTPPISEIEVIKSEDSPDVAATTRDHVNTGGGTSLSPELLKEVFPYHVVFDGDFRILQVGNNLHQILDMDSIVGLTVSDILMVTSPIPMYGKWDWSILEKMRENTVFLESAESDSVKTKVKMKGTIIEISASPRKVMMALFPNVKNLSELESMDLSMADLPLHSCQREAVLLGEHSKSEVKLTNHLDQLHRDLIDSMEKQIEERTQELATANQDLERANTQLAIQSARQLEHFACMSHEIRTPLNCIVGMSSLLLDDADDMDPMHADSIRMINTSGDLLKAVVDDVLDYAKLESGTFEVDIKPTNLQETLASVVHSISQKVLEKNIRLRTHYSPTLPLILETDSRRLQQVLFNLLGNAGKFSKPNSVIDLCVTLMTGPLQQEEGQPVMYSASGQIIRFAVIDYGKGIEKKDFKTIFEPFSQASKETQNVYGGTGLGLSITTKLVHRLGGTVGLDSEPGKYTSFTVDLPFAGTPVDVNQVRKKLLSTDLLLVEPPKTYDYSFSLHEILQEPTPFDDDVVETYGLNVLRCSSLTQAISEVENEQAKRHHTVLLIDESLLREATGTLEKLLQAPHITVITFGPYYSIPQTREWHFKSLLRVFPATLLETISTHVISQQKALGYGNPPRTSIVTSTESSSKASTDPAEAGEETTTYSETGMKGELLAAIDNTSTSRPLADAPANVSKSSRKNSNQQKRATGNMSDPLSTSNHEKTRRKEGLFAVLSSRSDDGLQGATADLTSQRAGLLASLSRPPGPEDVLSFRRNSIPISLPGGLFASLKGDKNGMSVQSTQSQNSSIPAFMDNGTSPLLRGSERKTSSPQRDLKVLYAEDNAINQKILSKMLSRARIANENITIVDNGQEAVDICKKEKFDIIFMDMQMPVMDGIEATRLIVKNDPKAIVYFVTAHALDEFRSQAEAVGAIGFFSKPVQLAQIEEVLDNLGKSSTVPKTTSQTNVLVSHPEEGAGASSPTSDALIHPPPYTQVRGFKVLYADDNKVNQKMLSRVLNRAGVTDITIVENGKAAVDLCLKEKFDCIFMDMEMPIMGGREATSLIVENDPQAIVAIVTAHTEEELQEKPSGAWVIIPKTFRLAQIEEFLKRLERRLGERDPNWNRVSAVPTTQQVQHPQSGETKSQDETQIHSPAAGASREKKQAPKNHDLKVLYAEDNLINQKVLSRILNRAGVSDITIVDNGKKAVEICATQKFDVIFMDMQMPVMDGVEACRRIVEKDPTARVVYVTAHALDEFKAQAVASGGSGWISKPFRLSDVQKLVEGFIES